ncbi:MAG: putative OsmC-like protein/alpha/beta superfamily hydrolase [Myxococcota bacterium]|jgi:uncharacterized OsmC-like protein/alpha/beta superfamily hydrolase
MAHELQISFEGALGAHLTGRLHCADDVAISPPRAYALFAHCFTCSKDIRAAVQISRALVDAGFAVLRFDFTGLGESAGEFKDTTFTSNIGDLVAGAAWLRANHAAPTLLIGHSLGGAAVLAAAHEIPECHAVVTLGAPAEPLHVRHLIERAAPDLKAHGEAEIVLGGQTLRIRQDFLDDLVQQTLAPKIAKLGRALLVMHSPTDEIVGIENAKSIYTAARHPKSFVSLDGADHLLRRSKDARYAAAVIAAWSSRYLPEPTAAPSTATIPAEGEVVVRGGATGFRQDIALGRHTLVADEPTSVGGLDAGPSPYDLLLAALGACTSMTMKMYADRKAWPLEQATVKLTHAKVHASDCADCENTGGKVDEITREITLVGDALTDAQRERILAIANKCPVHRTLHGEIKVRDILV